jgi:multidrug efflux system outer membrane protein
MVGPDYKRPDMQLPATFAEPASSQAPAIPAQWWTLYRDPVLDELVRVGLERSADVRLAVARVEEAEAALREARALLFFPEIDGNAGASRSRTLQFGTANTFSLGVSTSFELDVWRQAAPRGTLGAGPALAASRYGRDNRRAQRSPPPSRARTSPRARSIRSTSPPRRSCAATNESLSLAKKRTDAGLASGLDLYQAISTQSAAAAQSKEIARQRATGACTSWVCSPGARSQGRLEGHRFAAGAAASAGGLPSQLLERRPDVRQAEVQLAAATERIGVAKGSQFPTLKLTGSYGAQSSDLDTLFSSGAASWSLGANLLGPILDGGPLSARAPSRPRRRRSRPRRYTNARWRTHFATVSDALSNVKAAADSESDLFTRLDASRKRASPRAAPIRAGLLGVPRSAGCAAHAERRAAHLHPQPPGLPVLHRGPHEFPGRWLARVNIPH